MKKQVTVQDLMKAFRGMFPQEIHQLLTTHEKYFGFRVEGSRTKFVLNSYESQSKFDKVFIGSELRQLAEKFIKYKVCQYDCSQIPQVVQQEVAVKGTGVEDKYMIANCTPHWLTIEQTLDLFNKSEDLYWLLRYKKFRYRWCRCDKHQWFVAEKASASASPNVVVCEFPHTQAVLKTLISESKVQKPHDPLYDK